MRFAATAAAAGLAGVAAAQGGYAQMPANGTTVAPVYVTEVVTAFTTYCPEATQITHGGQTYTVSSATTLTITNCPGGCTITKPVSSSTPVAPVPYTSSSAVMTSSSPVAPVPYSSASASSSSPVAPAPYSSSSAAVVPYPSGNATVPSYSSGVPVGPVGTGSATSTATGTSSPIASYTGAASKANVAAGSLFALLGLVAVL